jgi:putative DNA primase/helicase
LYGSGGNGKGVFIRILSALFGEYGTPVNKEILFQAANRIVGDGANLPGKRFVTASEVSGRGELDSDRIKAWTGSDEMIARELYKPAFSFQPQFKLWLSFNSRPAIYDQSEGMWRRLRMIPFDRKFEGADRNFNLYEELHAELPGILNWAIQGCLEYQESKRGLEVPASVETVNRAYRDDFNPFVNFLTDQCIVQSSFSCNASEFHARYVKWCKEQNEKPLGKPRVAEQLKALGIYKERPKTGVTRQWQFYGLELVPEYSAFSGERLPVAV